jgi:hypothetical protein
MKKLLIPAIKNKRTRLIPEVKQEHKLIRKRSTPKVKKVPK